MQFDQAQFVSVKDQLYMLVALQELVEALVAGRTEALPEVPALPLP
jgi:hypothetical protein